VSTGNLIQYAYVFTTFNARSLTSEVVLREGPLRRTTRHLAAGTVRAGVKTLRCTASFDDERFRAHRSGNNAVDVFVGVDCAFTRDENLLAIVLFERNVVVMAVDLKLRLKRAAMIEHLVEDFQQTRHHDFAVLHR